MGVGDTYSTHTGCSARLHCRLTWLLFWHDITGEQLKTSLRGSKMLVVQTLKEKKKLQNVALNMKLAGNSSTECIIVAPDSSLYAELISCCWPHTLV